MRIDKVNATVAVYHSIRETAKLTGLSEYHIRKLHKAGAVPGIYSGKKFLVNVPSLLESLNASTEEVAGNEPE